MGLQLMTYTRYRPSLFDPAGMSIHDLRDELKYLRDSLPAARLEREQRSADAERQAGEHRERVAFMTRNWGAQYTPEPTPARVGEARDAVQELAAQIAAMEARRDALLAAYDVRVAQERDAIAAESADLDAQESALASREERLRELTAPLLEFEGYPNESGILSLEGQTALLRAALRRDRRYLSDRRMSLSMVGNTVNQIRTELA